MSFFKKVDIIHDGFWFWVRFFYFLRSLNQRRTITELTSWEDTLCSITRDIALLLFEEVEDGLIGDFLYFIGQWYFFRLVLSFGFYLVYKLRKYMILGFGFIAGFLFIQFLQVHLDQML